MQVCSRVYIPNDQVVIAAARNYVGFIRYSYSYASYCVCMADENLKIVYKLCEWQLELRIRKDSKNRECIYTLLSYILQPKLTAIKRAQFNTNIFGNLTNFG